MGRRSRDKGKRGEREAAEALREHLGVQARRGVQYHGGPGSPDLATSLPGVHFEVKRCESLSLYAAMDQAARDAAGKIPVVLHRRNGKEWLVVVQLRDLKALITDNLSQEKTDVRQQQFGVLAAEPESGQR